MKKVFIKNALCATCDAAHYLAVAAKQESDIKEQLTSLAEEAEALNKKASDLLEHLL